VLRAALSSTTILVTPLSFGTVIRRAAGPLFLILLLSAAAACGARAAPPSGAGPHLPEIREYPLADPSAYPNDVALDTLGHLWVTDRARGVILRFDRSSAQVEEISLGDTASVPYGIVAGPAGALWVALSRGGAVARIDPETRQVERFPVPGSAGPRHLAWDGARLWFTLRGEPRYGWLDPSTGETGAFDLPDGARLPYELAAAGDGVLWLTFYRRGELGRIDTASGQLEVRPVVPGRPHRITAGQDREVWYADLGGGRMVRIAADGTLTPYPPDRQLMQAYGVAVDGCGRVVYNDFRHDRMLILDPVADRRTEVRIPTPGGVARKVVVDAERQWAWFALAETARIGWLRLPPCGVTLGRPVDVERHEP
jgi:virginiamycin B lyase